MSRTDFRRWNEVVDSVSNAVEMLGSPSTIWYRGVPSTKHSLTPSLLRYRNGIEKERELYDRYDQWARGMSDASVEHSGGDWTILFNMQHFGVPTRLLDWTEVFGVAVFFALLDSQTGDSALYVLDPIALNRKIGKQDLIEDWHNDRYSYKKIFWHSDPFMPNIPMALNPRHENYRLRAQRGRFTIHGTQLQPLDIQVPDCVQRVVLPERAKEGALAFLRLSGINEFSAFPDVFGAAPFLKKMVGLVT